MLDKCDIVVDVGGKYEPARKRYDHHQRYHIVYQGIRAIHVFTKQDSIQVPSTFKPIASNQAYPGEQDCLVAVLNCIYNSDSRTYLRHYFFFKNDRAVLFQNNCMLFFIRHLEIIQSEAYFTMCTHTQ